jgi:iron-sulfur cluster repair protein YtfE (RIC family)
MKRDPRLQGLSSDHHHGLVLARRTSRACAGDGAGRELVRSVRRAFDAELEPHFRAEEEVLLPPLAGVAPDLVQRTLGEHAELRGHLAAAEAGHPRRLAEFAALLERHIRFEERVLFPAAEARLPGEALDRVARRVPYRAP